MDVKCFCVSSECLVLSLTLGKTTTRKHVVGYLKALGEDQMQVRCPAGHQIVPLRAEGIVGKTCQDLKAQAKRARLTPQSVRQSLLPLPGWEGHLRVPNQG